MEKRSGPSTELWGTPVARSCDLETSPLQDTLKDLSERQACAHIDIKGGLSTCPFSSSRESALFFWGVFFFYINVYMCACVFLFAHSFPCQTNTKIKISDRVRKWDSVEFRCLSSLRISAQVRAAQQCSTHWSVHAHHRQAENRRNEALPPSLVVFVLVWRWVVINKRLSYLCLEFTANYPKHKRQILLTCLANIHDSWECYHVS